MGFQIGKKGLNLFLDSLKNDYDIYAPVVFEGGGTFSDTDCIRYAKINSIDEIEFEKKSNYSFKESILPVTQRLFYFTEESVKEADDKKKGSIVFLRACELNAVKRLDEMYLINGGEDYYYKRLRDRVKFILIGCNHSFENCFCVDMESNKCDEYSLAINYGDEDFYVDCKEEKWSEILKNNSERELEVTPNFVTENDVRVNIPENLTSEVAKSSMWNEYDSRCIACGRCNFVCPTCTCFTMQDIFYTDNGKVGERRRVWASCMVDGYTDVAGGESYRKKYGQRMRFKVLHKVLDFKQRSGYHMCVGCGRCDDINPDYISFSNSINKLEAAMEEVTKKND